MSRLLKFLSAIALLPACLGCGKAVWQVAQASGREDTVWAAVLAGVACWLVVFLLLPKPMWIYVAGHEASHALWTWLFGGRVKRFKVGAGGGHVVVTRTNFLIALAPYFFPLYAVVVVAVFGAGHLVWGWARYAVWFHLLLGAAYAFHVTLTCQILRTTQTDITEHGYTFSAVVIWLGNMLVLLVGLPVLTGGSVLKALAIWMDATLEVFHQVSRLW